MNPSNPEILQYPTPELKETSPSNISSETQQIQVTEDESTREGFAEEVNELKNREIDEFINVGEVVAKTVNPESSFADKLLGHLTK